MTAELLEQDPESEESEPSASGREERAWTLDEIILVARLLFWVGRVGDADRLLRPFARAPHSRADLLQLWAQIKHTRGQLTDAIRSFERLGALLPRRENGLLELEIIRRVAQHPEAAKRELDLVGDDAVARKQRAQMELERAFRLAADQKFTTAVTACEQVAEKFRALDPHIFKLALLEKALFLESIGQFDGAIQTLESLGNTRGFEVDRDRLLSLARIYERRGTPEDLARVHKVYSFLHEQSGAAEYLSRMSRVAVRRGDKKEAERLESAFIRAFKKEQLELELEEVLDAAALKYVPLPALRKLATAPEDLARVRKKLEQDPEKHKRRLALLLAISGETEKSAELWSSLIQGTGSSSVDAKYFADLREEAGDAIGARALYLAAISRESAADTSVLGKLFAHEDDSLRAMLVSIFEDRDKRARTLDALKQAAKSNQLSPDIWHTLARFEGLISHDEASIRHRNKAEALARVQPKMGPRIGHVQVAAVYELQGIRRGLIHEIWASRYRTGTHGAYGEGGQLDEGSIFGNVARDMMRDIQNVFVAVRTFVEQKFPHLVEDLGEYRYVLKVTKDDEQSGGSSAGIAVALAFVSVFLQKPVPQDFAITGSLVADSSSEISLARVADVEHKVLGVYQRRLPRLILPSENRPDLDASNLVPRRVWEDRVAFARNLTQVMKLVFGADLWEW